MTKGDMLRVVDVTRSWLLHMTKESNRRAKCVSIVIQFVESPRRAVADVFASVDATISFLLIR
jgi:hypothetical protein